MVSKLLKGRGLGLQVSCKSFSRGLRSGEVHVYHVIHCKTHDTLQASPQGGGGVIDVASCRSKRDNVYDSLLIPILLLCVGECHSQ